jgi:Ca2+/H+ antiporter, TMEM165/GDT1 family
VKSNPENPAPMTSPPISTEDNSPHEAAAPDFSGVWRCFFSTFVTIFLAELGDKTQVATLLMSAQSHQPWVVFGGAAAALVSTSLVGVLLGQWLAKYLTPQKLELATGSILAVVAVLLFIDIAGMP